MNNNPLVYIKLLSLLLFLATVQISCSKVDINTEGCTSIEDKMSLTKKDLETTCWYNEVYSFNNEIYTVCDCCDCDKAPMAIDCSGEPLCDWTEDCMVDFYDYAELIGYVDF